ncbi:MAG: EAL domain-containing protein [Phycisphaerales bacterium]
MAVRAVDPVSSRFHAVFGAPDSSDGVIRVESARLAELWDLTDQLNYSEKSGVLATPIDADGSFDAWKASPLDLVRVRIENPWFLHALRDEQFHFHFQPIVDLRTSVVHGNEALVRATHEGSPVSPAVLIESARAHRLLLNFDQTCRSIAIRQGAPVVSSGSRIFINFMPTTVYDPQVCLRTTFAAARDAGVGLSDLVFEVVESESFPDIGHLRSILDKYRAEGAKVALDDVGAGNTDLDFVDELRPDYVKLDRAILQRAVATGSTAMYIGLVRHCQELDVQVIAEGIETRTELEFCRELGIDFAQGFFLARPQSNPITGTLELDGDQPAHRIAA